MTEISSNISEVNPEVHSENLYYLQKNALHFENPQIRTEALQKLRGLKETEPKGISLIKCYVDAIENQNIDELRWTILEFKNSIEGPNAKMKASEPNEQEYKELLTSHKPITVYFATGSHGDRIFFQYDKKSKRGKIFINTDLKSGRTQERYQRFAQLMGKSHYNDLIHDDVDNLHPYLNQEISVEFHQSDQDLILDE